MIDNNKIANRVKYYRKILNVSQRELVTNHLSLQQIKFIETKRRKITFRTAERICSQLNLIAKYKNINLKLSPKELVMSDEDYARYLCKEELENKENIDEKSFLNICLQYNLKDILQDYYVLQGEIFGCKNEFKKALSFYNKAKDVEYIEEYSYISILNKIGICHINLCNWALGLKAYAEAEILIKFIYTKNKYEIKGIQDIESRVYYGIALINNEIDNHEVSLEYLDKINRLEYIDSKLIINSRILESNVNYKIGNVEKAIRGYIKLHDEFPNNLSIIVNLITLYEIDGNEELSNFYLDKINDDMFKKEEPSLYIEYLIKKKNYFIKFDITKAIKYYNSAIKLSIKDNNILCLTKIYENIIEDYNNCLISSNYLNQYLIILNRNKHIYDNHKEFLNDILVRVVINENINKNLLDTIRKINRE